MTPGRGSGYVRSSAPRERSCGSREEKWFFSLSAVGAGCYISSILPLDTHRRAPLLRSLTKRFSFSSLPQERTMFGLGMGELLVVLAIGLLLFGKSLPGLAHSLGRSMLEF